MRKFILSILLLATFPALISNIEAMTCRGQPSDPHFGFDRIEGNAGYSTLLAARTGFFFEFSGNTCQHSRINFELEAGVTAGKASINYEFGSVFGGLILGPAAFYNYWPSIGGIKGLYSGGELSMHLFQVIIRIGAFAPLNSVNTEQSNHVLFQAQVGYLFEIRS